MTSGVIIFVAACLFVAFVVIPWLASRGASTGGDEDGGPTCPRPMPGRAGEYRRCRR